MSTQPVCPALTTAVGAPVPNNQNTMTVGPLHH